MCDVWRQELMQTERCKGKLHSSHWSNFYITLFVVVVVTIVELVSSLRPEEGWC